MKKGKKVAKDLGVYIIGLVGILLIYKKRGILSIDELKLITLELDSVDFRLSSSLLRLLLED
ncbi:MAG TPA: hypothetical protein EYG69_01990 [Campylobacterales bacterium]|nr:hypothetical protein [Campylobacterales bacterium]